LIAEFNWNEYNTEKIRSQSLKNMPRELRKSHFKGVISPKSEISLTIDITIEEAIAGRM